MNRYFRIALSAISGAVVGYAYYYFIGCNSGHCPITSNWEYTTLYGVVMGVVLFFPTKKKKNRNAEKEESKQEYNN